MTLGLEFVSSARQPNDRNAVASSPIIKADKKAELGAKTGVRPPLELSEGVLLFLSWDRGIAASLHHLGIYVIPPLLV